MKYLISIVFFTVALNNLQSQYLENCIPKDWIVIGDNVNFRSEPSTNSLPKGKFTKGELLIFKEIVSEDQKSNWFYIWNSWLKVLRVRTGEIGFVYGKYVRPQEVIRPDIKMIPFGNWYTIFQEGPKVLLERWNPTLQVNDKGDTLIVPKHEGCWLSICSQFELKEGNIEGRIYREHEGNFSFGMQEVLLKTQNKIYSLTCSAENEFTRLNERVFFITQDIGGTQSHYLKQDLTDCLLKFGEGNYYHLIFAGDLNDDGIPEIILSEGDNKGIVVYYFMSNKEGYLELKSITGGSDNC